MEKMRKFLEGFFGSCVMKSFNKQGGEVLYEVHGSWKGLFFINITTF